MEVKMAVAIAGYSECKCDHYGAVEGPDDLSADLVGDHEHSQRDQFRVGKAPYLLLQIEAHAGFFDVDATSDYDVSAHYPF
jgi:hypothetical protein